MGLYEYFNIGYLDVSVSLVDYEYAKSYFDADFGQESFSSQFLFSSTASMRQMRRDIFPYST